MCIFPLCGESRSQANGGTMQRATVGSVSQENQVTEDLIGENRLWTAVILNAIDDWRYGTLRARARGADIFYSRIMPISKMFVRGQASMQKAFEASC